MKLHRLMIKVIWLLFLLAFASACQPALLQETTVPTTVVQQPTGTPGLELAGEMPQADPTPTQAPAQGFVLFDQEKGEFNGYGMDGSLRFTSQAPGIQFPSGYNTRVVNGAVYFITENTKQVMRSSPEGLETVNIPTQNLWTFAVSPDEKLLAWSTLDGTSGASELWIANRDGSQARQVAQYKADMSPAFLFFPEEWTADGRLIFDRSMTGFGGYILFGGQNGLYSYDPAAGEFVTLVPAEEMHGLCLDSYRLDLDKVVFNCGKQGQGPAIIIRDLASQNETILPALPDQGLTGSARYSPSGKWLAYAIAKGQPENESGQIVVIPADLSTEATSIAQVADNSYAYVQGWLDDNTLLFSRITWPEGTAWSVKRDGSDLTQIASGMFIGWFY